MCKHKKSLALIYVQNDPDFFSKIMSACRRLLSFLIINSPSKRRGVGAFPSRFASTETEKTSRKKISTNFKSVPLETRRRPDIRNYLFEKSLGPREHLPTSASHAILFLSSHSFILSHSSFLSLYSFVTFFLSFSLIRSRILQ